jgi:mycothiol system anti-sigma-R factor
VSCGEPHDDCRGVLEQVYLYLDGEMDDDACAEIRKHLEDCSPCLREFGIEQEFKALIARKCQCDNAPAELRTKLLVRLREVSLQIDHVEYRPE